MGRGLRSSLAGLVTCIATTFALSAAADEPAAPAAPEDARNEARLHFTAGVNLLQDPERPRYEEAYREFKRAYELAGSPTILGNIGLCAMKLERDAEAIDAYTRYLAEVKDLDPAERAQAERDLVTLKAGLAKITIESRPDGAMIRDVRVPARGEGVTNTYGPIQGRTELAIRRGHHVIKARFPQGGEATWELDVHGGEEHVFERPPEKAPLQLVQPAPVVDRPTRPIPRGVYIGGIVTAGLAIATVATGVVALSTHERFNDANTGNDLDRATRLHSTGETLNVVADVCLGATILGAAFTTYLYLARPTVHTSANQGRGGRITVSPGSISGVF